MSIQFFCFEPQQLRLLAYKFTKLLLIHIRTLLCTILQYYDVSNLSMYYVEKENTAKKKKEHKLYYNGFIKFDYF